MPKVEGKGQESPKGGSSEHFGLLKTVLGLQYTVWGDSQPWLAKKVRWEPTASQQEGGRRPWGPEASQF